MNALQHYLLKIIKRAGAGGVRSGMRAPDHSAQQISNALNVLKVAGTIHSVRVSHKVCRYFFDKHDADVYATRQKTVSSPEMRVNLGTHKKKHLLRGKAPWAADAPMVITKRTKITVAKTPPAPLRTNTYMEF